MSAQSQAEIASSCQVRQAWRWRVIPAVVGNDPNLLLAALVVADASLDAVLLGAGYPGTTIAERLQNASHAFSDYAGLRAARQIRHRAVHQLGYRVCRSAVMEALGSYARALWEHGIDLNGIWYPDGLAIDAPLPPVLLSSHERILGKGAASERGEPRNVTRHLAAAGPA